MLRRYKLKNYNFRLVILLIAISIIGVLLIGSADSADQKKQAIGVVLDDAWRSLSRRFYRKKHVWCDPLDSDRKLSVSADRAVKNLSDHVFCDVSDEA